MSLHNRLSQSAEGRSALAAARLRYSVLKSLTRALRESGLSQSELANRLGLRRSAVNAVFKGTGNVRVNTVAEYLDSMGFEATLVISPTGDARFQTQEWRELTAPRTPVSVGAAASSLLSGKDSFWSPLGPATPKLDDVRPSKRSNFAIAA